MGIIETIKPFYPIILTFLLPRAFSYYRSLRIAIKTRPPPGPLPPKVSSALNVLFASICLFLFLSVFPSSYLELAKQPNLFEETQSRLLVPTDVLAQRVSSLKRLASPVDQVVLRKITTPVSRQLYLRYGPGTLLSCPFCDAKSPQTYLLHYLPLNLLLPHFLHLLLLGLATSAPISGFQLSRLPFRRYLIISAIVLAVIDASLTVYCPLQLDNQASSAPPLGIYWMAQTFRPIAIIIFDSIAAATIYLVTTNRLPFLFPIFAPPGGAHEDPAAKKGRYEALQQDSMALMSALTKMRALGVVRSAVVRDGKGLKQRDDEYWRVVVGMEGVGSGAGSGEQGEEESVWEEEEVMEAIARVTRETNGERGLDVEKTRREAGAWVEGVTKGIERG